MKSKAKGNQMAGASAAASERLSPRQKEVVGLVAFCAGVVTLLSLVSYQPTDAVGIGAHPHNLIGPAGAAWAWVLFKAIGVSAYVIAAALLMLAVTAIRHMEIKVQLFEAAGWALLTLFTAAFLQIALGGRTLLGVDPGGFVGLYMGKGLTALFSGVGSLIILSALILLCLLMATNISIKAAAVFTGTTVAAAARFAYRRGDAALAHFLPAPAMDGPVTEVDVPEILVPRKEGKAPPESNPDDESGEDRPAPRKKAVPELDGKAAKDAKPNKDAEKDSKVVDLAQVRDRKAKEEGPSITVSAPMRPKKKRSEPEDNRPVYDPSKGFTLPSASLLASGQQKEVGFNPDTLRENAKLLEQKLHDYGVDGKVINIRPGPIITMYEFRPGPGIKVAKISNLQNDLAMALSAISVRIVAPIPGKDVVGIEVPNKERNKVFLREVVEAEAFNHPDLRLPLALGKDIEGMPAAVDLAKMPHLLVAGATGAGKSVSINSMIMSLLFKRTPEEVKFILVDPKMVELKPYEGIPHLLLPVVTDPKKAALALRWAVEEMERRYQLLADLTVREISFYNQKVDRILKNVEPMPELLKAKIAEARQAALTGIGRDGKPAPDVRPYEFAKLPYIVIVVDEFADLMMVASRDVENSVARLAQMARAVGIHIILATQRPSTDVISGVIKANFPARIAFKVFSQIDSRTILDSMGAENLVGNGDMLILSPGSAALQRVHGAFVNENDIKAVVDFLKEQGKPVFNEEILKPRPEGDGGDGDGEGGDEYDELYDNAVAIVCREQKASISYLQRKLQVGYNRAARMIERMEAEGILGAQDGKGQREIKAPAI